MKNERLFFTMDGLIPLEKTWIDISHLKSPHNFIFFPCMVSDKTFVYLTPMESPVEVALGSKEAILSVAVYAYPEPELVWYKGDVPIDVDDRHYDVR